MELKKYALSNVCSIVPGYAFKSSDFGSGENIAIKIKDIEPPYVNIKNAERVCFTPQDKFRLSQGDFVMAMTGATIGKVGKLELDAKNVYINQRVCKFEPITSVCDKKYLYYVLSTPSFRNFIYNNIDSKLAQPNIGHPTIYKYTHLFPINIEEQKLVASVLNNLDRKIELNRQINDNLEAMAKQLYDYWFVQFDFPDEEGKPYKSSGGAMVWNEKLKREIPQGWVVEKMGKCTTILLGGTPDTNDNSLWGNGYNWLNSGEVAEFPILKSEKNITPKGLEKSATVLAPKGSVTLSITRHLRPSILCIDACINQSVVAILENDKITKEYIYQLLSRDIPRLMSLRTGAQQPHINKETVEAIHVVLPPADIMGAYINIVESIYDAIFNNAREVEELTKQRDELLPLLMNGQATVNYHLSDD